jgi:hypothetical protein
MKFYKDILPQTIRITLDKTIHMPINNVITELRSSSSSLIPNKNNDGYHMNQRFVNYYINEQGRYLNCEKNIVTVNKYIEFDKEFNIIKEKWFDLNNDNRLYVGGNFASVFDSSNTTLLVKYMAQWNTTNSRWSRIGANTTYNGVNGIVNILQYNSSSKYLLTVGSFSIVNDSVTTKIREIANYATFKF